MYLDGHIKSDKPNYVSVSICTSLCGVMHTYMELLLFNSEVSVVSYFGGRYYVINIPSLTTCTSYLDTDHCVPQQLVSVVHPGT